MGLNYNSDSLFSNTSIACESYFSIINDDIEEEPMTYRKIGFSTEDGDYTNGENEEDDKRS